MRQAVHGVTTQHWGDRTCRAGSSQYVSQCSPAGILTTTHVLMKHPHPTVLACTNMTLFQQAKLPVSQSDREHCLPYCRVACSGLSAGVHSATWTVGSSSAHLDWWKPRAHRGGREGRPMTSWYCWMTSCRYTAVHSST
jgi:hypothetical protein